jgi:hypothetical protein
MNPATAQFLMASLKIIGVMLGIFLGFLVVMYVPLSLYIRRHVQNRVIAVFEDAKQLYSRLLVREGSNPAKVYLGRGDKREEYILDDRKQKWSYWPPYMPGLIGLPVKAYCFSRGDPACRDFAGTSSAITARALRLMNDEAMLRVMWRDVKEAAMGAVAGMNKMMLYVMLGMLLLTGVNLILLMNLQKAVAGISKLVIGH